MKLRYLVLLSVPPAWAAGPSVTIGNGTIVGWTFNGVDHFKGIPYAQPPVGSRRLRPPAPLATPFGTITAAADGQACPTLGVSLSIPSTVREALATTTPSDQDIFRAAPTGTPGRAGPEDCLFLNVQRPAGTAATRKLPVLLWIYGGAFVGGATLLYDASSIVSSANNLGQPFLFVTFNYRLGAFGWLAGKELSDEGSTNLGLRDQRFVMQWVQDNIAAFGGDPTRITIWGQSAGSISVFDHLLVNNADNQYKGKPLFTGAIMDSGTAFPAFPVTHPRPQGTFNKLAQNAGCGSAANKLQCLRGVDYDTFFAAQNAASETFESSGLAYLPRPDPASTFFPVSPERAVAAGAFLKIPMIVGSQEDEGTIFVLASGQTASSTDKIVDFLVRQAPELPRADARAFVDTYPGTYPQSVTEGSPFGTGYANELYPGFKRLAALYGDATFTLARRIALDSLAADPAVNVWSYLSTYNRNLPFVGTAHGTDVLAIFYGLAPGAAVSESQYRYLSFIHYADPNVLGVRANGGYTQWPRYTLDRRPLLNIGAFGAYYSNDDFRQASYSVLKRNISALAI